MDVTQNSAVGIPGQDEGLSSGTVGAMMVFFLLLAAAGYFLMQKTAPAAKAATGAAPVNPLVKKTLPTVAPGATTPTSGLSGLLTAPGFFTGLMNLATSIQKVAAPSIAANKSTGGGGGNATAATPGSTQLYDDEGYAVNADGTYTNTNVAAAATADNNADFIAGGGNAATGEDQSLSEP